MILSIVSRTGGYWDKLNNGENIYRLLHPFNKKDKGQERIAVCHPLNINYLGDSFTPAGYQTNGL